MADIDRSFSAIGSRREHDPNFEPTFVRGDGAYLWDHEGNRYIDFVGGYSSTLFGHAHPRLVGVAQAQLATLTQLVGLSHPWRNRLEAELVSRVQATIQSPLKAWLTTTGARAAELAWKLAYAYRAGSMMHFEASYHGRSLATAVISDTKKLPIIEAAVEPRLRYPRCDRCPVGLTSESCRAECFDEDEARIVADADRISAVFVEPALGARGYYFAPSIFFQRLRNVTRRVGILLIDDEVQMGLGRLGSFLAAERQGWRPDLVLLGKSLGGGLVPIACVVGRAEIMDALPTGFESETFAANPLACRIAIEALATLDDEDLIHRTDEIESRFRNRLQRLQQTSDCDFTFEVRGAAGVIRMTATSAERTARRAVALGLLVHWSGIERERLVLIPPLNVSSELIDEAFELLAAAMPTNRS